MADFTTIKFDYIHLMHDHVSEKSKGYRIYCPNHSTRIVETGNARFYENGEISGSHKDVIIKEIRVNIPIHSIPKERNPPVIEHVQDEGILMNDQEPHNEIVDNENVEAHHETKNYLSKNFEMKDMGEAFYVIGIEIFRDRSLGILGLSQKAYIDKVLERFNLMTSTPTPVPLQKVCSVHIKNWNAKHPIKFL